MAYMVEEPADTQKVVVDRSEAPERRSNTGVIIAVVIAALVILAILFFGTGFMRGGAPSTNTNTTQVQPPTQNTPQ